MALLNSPHRYGTVSKSLHGVIALLILIMLIGSFFMDDIADKSLKLTVFNLHKLTGIAILVLMVCRLVWRLSHTRPDIIPTLPHWQKVAATLVHTLLYTLVILMPLTGWIMSSAANHAPFIGAWSLALPFVSASKALSGLFFAYHQTIAWVIIGLLVLHIGAAITHRRMGP